MGGYGSGRPGAWDRMNVEDCLVLDVNNMKKLGALEEGTHSTWQWIRDDAIIASAGLRTNRDAITLNYRSRINDEDWIDVEEMIDIERIPCHLGGSRPYFICPGTCSGRRCGQRSTKLYLWSHRYRCRRCHRLTYRSQHEDALSRAIRRTDKAFGKLGAVRTDNSLSPPKPKGMWWSTYDRLYADAMYADRSLCTIAEESLQRFAARVVLADDGSAEPPST